MRIDERAGTYGVRVRAVAGPALSRLALPRRAMLWLALALVLTAASAVSRPIGAQERLLSARELSMGAVIGSWSFGSGIYQPTSDGADSVLVRRATQWSIPLGVMVPLSRRWTIDVGGSYASGHVSLARPDAARNTDHYTLSGITDLRFRVTGHLVGDNVLVTLGFNAPTGKTSLDAGELEAFRVLAAPALGFQTPVLGLGPGGTTGLVLAQKAGTWGLALGTSYEVRGRYASLADQAGLLNPELNPGNVLHLSLGADGLVGHTGMTLGASADFFTNDQFTSGGGALAGASPGTAAQAPNSTSTRLGPVLTADWQLRLPAPGFRELTVYAVERYRAQYKRGGTTVPGSSGNYLDAGVRSVVAVGRSTGIVTGLSLRHQSGLRSDNALSTAAITSGGLTLGLSRAMTSGYSLEPFVRAEVGRLRSSTHSVTATGLTSGITLRRRF